MNSFLPQNACLKLGIVDDPDSHYGFLSTEHRCCALEPAAEIASEHQASYCLNTSHVQCSVLRGKAIPSPERPSAPLPSGRTLWYFVIGLLTVLVLGVYLGGALLVITTQERNAVIASTPVQASSPPTHVPTLVAPPTSTPIPQLDGAHQTAVRFSDTPVEAQIQFPTVTIEPPPATIPCSPPADWGQYTIQPGDTLFGIAARYNTTVDELMQANCLASGRILAGSSLYIPGVQE